MGKTLLAGGLGGILLALAATGTANAQNKPDHLDPERTQIEAASKYIRDGQPQRALDEVASVLSSWETKNAAEKRQIYCGMNSVQTLLYMGMAASQKHDAVALSPVFCDALFLKAFALVDLGDVAGAQTIFVRLTTLAPQHARYWSELGNTYRLQKRWAEGLDAYAHAADASEFSDQDRKVPEKCVALRGTGYILVEQGKLDEAEKAYRDCLKISPDEPKSLGELEYIDQQRSAAK